LLVKGDAIVGMLVSHGVSDKYR